MRAAEGGGAAGTLGEAGDEGIVSKGEAVVAA